MSNTSSSWPTFLDCAKRSGDGDASKIIEVLTKTNEALEDIPVVQCNQGMQHITTIRTGIPAPAWRMLNCGVPKGKSTTTQIKVGCGMLEAYSEVDKKLVDLAVRNGGKVAATQFLDQENQAFYLGFADKFSETMFYGDNSDPKQPVGLCNYYNSTSAQSGENIILASSSATAASNCSVWLVAWSPNSVCGLYPQGSSAGFKQENLGEHTVQDGDGNQYQAYRSHFSWDFGFAVRDWRCAVRIANINFSTIKNDPKGTSAPKLIELMIKAYYKLPAEAQGYRLAFYAPRRCAAALHLQAMDTAKYQITVDNVGGKPVTSLLGIPIRRQDSLRHDEDALS